MGAIKMNENQFMKLEIDKTRLINAVRNSKDKYIKIREIKALTGISPRRIRECREEINNDENEPYKIGISSKFGYFEIKTLADLKTTTREYESRVDKLNKEKHALQLWWIGLRGGE